jgi:hypothetical protein
VGVDTVDATRTGAAEAEGLAVLGPDAPV